MIITRPTVTPGNVNSALNTKVTDFGLLCTHANINKWAKHKPVRHPTPGELPLSLENNYGLYVPYYRSLANMVEDVKNGSISNRAVNYESGLAAFDYKKPRGMAYQERFRLLDFDGYNSEAQQMFGQCQSPISLGLGASEIPLKFTNGLYADSVIRPTDLLCIDNNGVVQYRWEPEFEQFEMYLGVMLIKGGETRTTASQLATSFNRQTVTQFTEAINISPARPASFSDAIACMYISSVMKGADESAVTGWYIPLMFTRTRIALDVEPLDVTLEITSATRSGNVVTINWKVTDNNSIAFPGSTLYFQLYYINPTTGEETLDKTTPTQTVRFEKGENTGHVTVGQASLMYNRIEMHAYIYDTPMMISFPCAL